MAKDSEGAAVITSKNVKLLANCIKVAGGQMDMARPGGPVAIFLNFQFEVEAIEIILNFLAVC